MLVQMRIVNDVKFKFIDDLMITNPEKYQIPITSRLQKTCFVYKHFKRNLEILSTRNQTSDLFYKKNYHIF